jgi:hypothetical protein
MEWSFSPLVAIVIFLAFMFFGYGFGLIEGRNQGYRKREGEEQNEKPAQKSFPTDPPAAQASPPQGLLRLSQNDRGNLLLELDNHPVNTSTLTSDQRSRLIELLTMMRPWLEGKPATPPAAPPPSRPKPTPPAGRIPDSQPVSEPATPQAPPLFETEDEEHTGPQSMVMQIDHILQSRLVGTPLQDKGIRLLESMQGGVQVWVGMNKFESIDDVPDNEIQQAIRAAIAEWENKYTPGL